jgi:hypothetical protein
MKGPLEIRHPQVAQIHDRDTSRSQLAVTVVAGVAEYIAPAARGELHDD